MNSKDAIAKAIGDAFRARDDVALLKIATALNVFPTRKGAYNYLINEGTIK